MRFTPLGRGLVYSARVGGNSTDTLNGMFVDDYGTVYLTGATLSDDFPVVNAFDESHNGNYDVFVSVLP